MHILPRMLALSSLLCTGMLLALSCQAAAQNGSNGPDKPEPERHAKTPDLHIRLRVAPVVFPPRHKDRDRDRDEAGVIYDLAPSPEKFLVFEEMRSLAIDGAKNEQVRLKTIVMK